MLDWLLRGLVVAVLRRLFVVAAAPGVFIIATPVILLRAFVCSARHEEEFKFAGLDGYAAVWDGLVAAFMWRFTVTRTGLRPLDAEHLTNRWSRPLAPQTWSHQSF
jgi:hypothetical protein